MRAITKSLYCEVSHFYRRVIAWRDTFIVGSFKYYLETTSPCQEVQFPASVNVEHLDLKQQMMTTRSLESHL